MKRFAVVALALCVLGCGKPTSPFDSLRDATVVPGQGLGAIRLGSERLGPFIDRHGVNQVAGVFTDEDTFVELVYPREGLYFTFVFNEQCFRETRDLGGRVARELYEPANFFSRYPACRDAELTRILIGTDGRGRAWWQGRTSAGSRLGDSWPEVMAKEGTPQQQGPAYLALPRTQNRQIESLRYHSGIEVFFVLGAAGQSAEAGDRMSTTAEFIAISPGTAR